MRLQSFHYSVFYLVNMYSLIMNLLIFTKYWAMQETKMVYIMEIDVYLTLVSFFFKLD